MIRTRAILLGWLLVSLALPSSAFAVTTTEGTDGTHGEGGTSPLIDADTDRLFCSQAARGAILNLPGGSVLTMNACSTSTLDSTDVLPVPIYVMPGGQVVTGTGSATATYSQTSTAAYTVTLTTSFTGTGTAGGTGTLTSTGTFTGTGYFRLKGTGTAVTTATITGTGSQTSTATQWHVSIGESTKATNIFNTGIGNAIRQDSFGNLLATGYFQGGSLRLDGPTANNPDKTTGLLMQGRGSGADLWQFYPSTFDAFVLGRPGLRIWSVDADGTMYMGGMSSDIGGDAPVWVTSIGGTSSPTRGAFGSLHVTGSRFSSTRATDLVLSVGKNDGDATINGSGVGALANTTTCSGGMQCSGVTASGTNTDTGISTDTSVGVRPIAMGTMNIDGSHLVPKSQVINGATLTNTNVTITAAPTGNIAAASPLSLSTGTSTATSSSVALSATPQLHLDLSGINTNTAANLAGTLTTGKLPKASGANALVDSQASDNGTTFAIGASATTQTPKVNIYEPSGGVALNVEEALGGTFSAWSNAATHQYYAAQNLAATTGDFQLYVNTNGTTGWLEALRVLRASGNLCVGSTTCNSKISSGGSYGVPKVLAYDDGTYISGMGAYSTDILRIFATDYDKIITFGSQTLAGVFTEGMRLKAGKLGINTTNPAVSLDVYGSVQASNTVTCAGGLVCSGTTATGSGTGTGTGTAVRILGPSVLTVSNTATSTFTASNVAAKITVNNGLVTATSALTATDIGGLTGNAVSCSGANTINATNGQITGCSTTGYLTQPSGVCTSGQALTSLSTGVTSCVPVASLPADATGWLHDNGAGTLSWSTPTYLAVGADIAGAAAAITASGTSGKVAAFNGAGTLSNAAYYSPTPTASYIPVADASGTLNAWNTNPVRFPLNVVGGSGNNGPSRTLTGEDDWSCSPIYINYGSYTTRTHWQVEFVYKQTAGTAAVFTFFGAATPATAIATASVGVGSGWSVQLVDIPLGTTTSTLRTDVDTIYSCDVFVTSGVSIQIGSITLVAKP